MSENEIKNSGYYIDWLEKSITEEYFHYYEHSKFENIKEIGDKKISIVHRAKWKNIDHFCVLKSFHDKPFKDVVNELKIRQKTNSHPNIIQFYGITKIKSVDEINEYGLVLEYADSNTLDSYLNKHIVELSLYDKYQLAIQLASAVSYMHECDIIHRNLNSKNVLVHKKNIKVTGFSSAKKISDSTTNMSKMFGAIPYMDPKFLSNQNYELDRKSDVYSIGVLMWQISSGRQPFSTTDVIDDAHLISSILDGNREKFIDETPDEYNQLYAECWKYEPNERPTIQKVISTLNFSLSDYFQDDDRYSSDDDDDDDDDDLIDNTSKWIKSALKNDDLKYIPIGNLLNIQSLGTGRFGSVMRATWTKTKDYVVCKKIIKTRNKENAFTDELKIHLKLNYSDRIIRCLGISISKDQRTKEYILVMEHANGGDLQYYLEKNFNKLTWNDKKRLAFQIADGLYYLHNENILHRDLHSKNIVIHDNNAKIIDFGLSKFQDYNTSVAQGIFGVIPYVDPKRISDAKFPYAKSSDIYSFGVIMWEISSGRRPFMSDGNDVALVYRIINGAREETIPGTPKEYEELYKNCWSHEPEQRPTIDEIINEFGKMSDVRNRLNPSELINFIIDYKLTKFIKKDELKAMTQIYSGSFGSISTATWMKTDSIVVCKKIKNNESINKKQIEAFLHELDMHRRLDFCPRIIRILGISFDINVHEYLLIMEYADGGDLRKYLKENFPKLTWDDKIKLAYQITEGIKFLQKENILHRDLHSGNIVIHQGEAKIIDLGIAKSTETETHIHSNVLGVVAYIDPKRLENYLYKYNEKSDIYSLGVLMWELSSGKSPFIDNDSEHHLKIHLIDGLREEPVDGTPEEYLKLYKECWDGNPDKRPTIKEVFNRLIKLGKMMDIQYFQNINYDNDDASNNIHDGNDNDTDLQDNKFRDDNDDLYIPDDFD
ncbi:hypothetical protein RclHR1_01810011 [Rhizophagus clarus]|uniref:Kinase-like domain-containing protein n=1 Tax=Rhizophagus clarus TaxID=94130 RepID=A0A2Z6REU4_9GLOM|nr:hypothetical protein RclHR1_01810011 [Rhizophagus clarus]GES75229.1 kinase-like domain-containing protein [Rhizophagus clarus]